MKKIIVGIACCSTFNNNDNIFDDRYYILNNYIDPIIKNGGIPIGILYKDDQLIKDSLKLCDAFLIPGGSRIIKPHLEIIDYAIKNNKPLLGICMGMQALSLYSLYGVDGLKKQEENIILIENNQFHNMLNPKRNNKSKTIHSVSIKQNTLLNNILKKDHIKVNSLHKYKVLKVGPEFIISATSKDNVIEAIEHQDKNKFILGVEWHPELMNNMDELFKYLIEKAKAKF